MHLHSSLLHRLLLLNQLKDSYNFVSIANLQLASPLIRSALGGSFCYPTALGNVEGDYLTHSALLMIYRFVDLLTPKRQDCPLSTLDF